MSRPQVVYLHVTVALTAITGAVYAVMKYFMEPIDEFSVINHPLQPAMLDAHVIAAPFLVFAFGWVFADHIWPRFRFGEPRNRRSGLAAMSLIIPMTLSAYLLQVSTHEPVRQAMAAAHWVTSGLFVIVYVAHLIGRPEPPQ